MLRTGISSGDARLCCRYLTGLNLKHGSDKFQVAYLTPFGTYIEQDVHRTLQNGCKS
jgi:hypothetical protein